MVVREGQQWAREADDKSAASDATRAPLRLTVLLTHPVQYYAPWFRYIAAECAGIALTVLYATEPTPNQQGVGFGTAFEWDVPLRQGYFSRVVSSPSGRESVHSDSFFGLNTPGLTEAMLASTPDVVLIPGWHSITLVRALCTCRWHGIPALYRGDSNLQTRPSGWRRPIWAMRTFLLLKLYEYYLSVGTNAYKYLRAFGIPESRIARSPHCVDNARFAREAKHYRERGSRCSDRQAMGIRPVDFVILFVGKLESKKCVEHAIRAIACSERDMHLVVVGAGAERARLEAMALENGVSVKWMGFLNQSEVGRAYALADCLVLPSDARETWGLVVNEALAAGIPAVVSDRVGCAADLVIEERTGAIFPFGDATALAQALCRVRTAQNIGRITPDTCREHIAKYSFGTATHGLLEICQRVRTDQGAMNGG